MAPSAARLQLELDRPSWSPGCGGRAEGWDGEAAHSRWPGNVLENANLTIKIRVFFLFFNPKTQTPRL